jgi:hypothetical protein
MLARACAATEKWEGMIMFRTIYVSDNALRGIVTILISRNE